MRRACDNPFAVHRVLRERYRLSASEWQELMARLELLGWRGAIVGPHGSGKTTLLEDLAGRLEGQGWRIHLLRFNADQRRLAFPPRWEARDFVLCDGAEQLSFLDWRRLALRAGSAGGLVVTTHRTGRLPVLHRCETSVELLHSLAASLGVPLSSRECGELHARYHGNLRAALSELYDRWTIGRLPAAFRQEPGLLVAALRAPHDVAGCAHLIYSAPGVPLRPHRETRTARISNRFLQFS